MTVRQLAWGIALWPFVLVLEMIGVNHFVRYDWDIAPASVAALLGGWALVALLCGSLVWLPIGGLLLRKLSDRSPFVQGLGLAALGLVMGLLAVIVIGIVATAPALIDGYSISGDFGGWVAVNTPLTTMFVLPSVLGWVFATIVARKFLATQRASGRI